MSHASCIVALSPDQISKSGSVQNAVAYQMEPFREENEWFEDGTRWDWFVIGGRYTGKLSPFAYGPEDDPRNFQVCWLCNGGGKRNDALGLEARLRDPAYTCNGCKGTGRMLKSASEWANCGNVCKRGDLTEAILKEARRSEAESLWKRWEAEPKKDDDFIREYMYGLKLDDTPESVIARAEQSYLSAYAFLKDHRWCEGERLVWFAAKGKTECELKAEERGEDFTGRCIHTCPRTAAKIVTWGEEDDRWSKMYWPRFIRGLSPETTLAVVDYHV